MLERRYKELQEELRAMFDGSVGRGARRWLIGSTWRVARARAAFAPHGTTTSRGWSPTRAARARPRSTSCWRGWRRRPTSPSGSSGWWDKRYWFRNHLAPRGGRNRLVARRRCEETGFLELDHVVPVRAEARRASRASGSSAG